MSLANKDSTEVNLDDYKPITDTLDELVADFGLRAVIAAVLQSEAGQKIQSTGGSESLRIVQSILREIVYAEDPQLEAEVMAIGAGLFLEDKMAVTRIAKKHGLSKAAVSKRAVRFCAEKGLPPSQFMRPERDRETYALTNRPRIT